MTVSVVAVVAATLGECYPVFDENGHINGTVPGRGAWDCSCGDVYNGTLDEVLTHAAGAVLAGLRAEGYAITRPANAEEEDRNVW